MKLLVYNVRAICLRSKRCRFKSICMMLFFKYISQIQMYHIKIGTDTGLHTRCMAPAITNVKNDDAWWVLGWVVISPTVTCSDQWAGGCFSETTLVSACMLLSYIHQGIKRNLRPSVPAWVFYSFSGPGPEARLT